MWLRGLRCFRVKYAYYVDTRWQKCLIFTKKINQLNIFLSDSIFDIGENWFFFWKKKWFLFEGKSDFFRRPVLRWKAKKRSRMSAGKCRRGKMGYVNFPEGKLGYVVFPRTRELHSRRAEKCVERSQSVRNYTGYFARVRLDVFILHVSLRAIYICDSSYCSYII